jgi:hypothetical protein
MNDQATAEEINATLVGSLKKQNKENSQVFPDGTTFEFQVIDVGPDKVELAFVQDDGGIGEPFSLTR